MSRLNCFNDDHWGIISTYPNEVKCSNVGRPSIWVSLAWKVLMCEIVATAVPISLARLQIADPSIIVNKICGSPLKFRFLADSLTFPVEFRGCNCNCNSRRCNANVVSPTHSLFLTPALVPWLLLWWDGTTWRPRPQDGKITHLPSFRASFSLVHIMNFPFKLFIK